MCIYSSSLCRVELVETHCTEYDIIVGWFGSVVRSENVLVIAARARNYHTIYTTSKLRKYIHASQYNTH